MISGSFCTSFWLEAATENIVCLAALNLSFSTANDHSSDHKSNFIVIDPLQSCELTSEKAAKTARCRTPHTKSSSFSIEFFKQNGWSDAQVMKLMQREPRVLRASVDTVLKPRMRSLQDMGFSDTEIVQLVSSCPRLLYLRDIQPRINFWRSLLGSDERLIKASRRNLILLTCSLPQKIEPNISILRECGISKQCIADFVVKVPWLICRSNKYIKEAIKHVEELGVSRDCKMFPHILLSASLSRSKFNAKSATLMSFGWSQPDIIALVRKCPSIWKYAKKNLSDKMTFLMKEAGCELTYISCRPVLLTYSLEKRLRPRYEVLNYLEQNKLLDKRPDFLTVMMLSEEKFGKKFLFLLREEKFIALYDSYVAAVQGKHPDAAEN
ncbi:hypothetical protein GW17_00053033 [Ensete ventricosum]|nr:hypothetical protein GW17_00053033 [Ensete ventricosum]RZS27333.1 hypothetical protein BHM03_00060792 [Ensete ventricosum]